jgi:AcrR family transcriptional regulator
MKPTARAPDLTRRKILMAAFTEFYEHGFQGGSLNKIVEEAGATKGALFHHFDGKQELGYAVLDEVIAPLLQQRWIDPIVDSKNPVADLKRTFKKYVKEDIESGHFVHGCPLNNLAQEMSPLDDGFRTRIDHLYDRWRKAIATALAAGIEARTVRKDVPPRNAATLLVAAQMGIWGTGKSSQNKALMLDAAEAVCSYLDTLGD